MSRFNPMLLKVITMGVLMLLLLIPLKSVESLIAERSDTRATAVERVARSSGHEQRIGAAILIVPVTRTWCVDGKLVSQIRNLRVLASDVLIAGSVSSETRHAGIYQIPTYQAAVNISGSFGAAMLQDELADEQGVDKRVGRGRLFVAISDPTGIRSLDGVEVDGVKLPVLAASENSLSGISAELPLKLRNSLPRHFSLDITVSGTERLQWLPLADSTIVKLTSTWPDPSFSGMFAPQRPTITQRGFTAEWHVLQINRDFPQHWIDETVTEKQITRQAFGVDFYLPVDTYQENYRSIHYAILFIAVTFMTLFLWEHTIGKPIHAIQYAMVGAALSLFYLMLLALSEHLVFGLSYGLSAAAMIGLLTLYFAGALDSLRVGALAGSLIGMCYLLLYWLVLSEDYALLSGTLALFFLLAGIMVGTRKFDWYSIAAQGSRRV